MQNGYIETFNGKFRDECLNEHCFQTLSQAEPSSQRGGRTSIRCASITALAEYRQLNSQSSIARALAMLKTN